jgi:hypothetical protein
MSFLIEFPELLLHTHLLFYSLNKVHEGVKGIWPSIAGECAKPIILQGVTHTGGRYRATGPNIGLPEILGAQYCFKFFVAGYVCLYLGRHRQGHRNKYCFMQRIRWR